MKRIQTNIELEDDIVDDFEVALKKKGYAGPTECFRDTVRDFVRDYRETRQQQVAESGK